MRTSRSWTSPSTVAVDVSSMWVSLQHTGQDPTTRRGWWGSSKRRGVMARSRAQPYGSARPGRSVGVGEGDDVAEDLVQRAGVTLALLAGRRAGQLFQIEHQRLELRFALPIHRPEPLRQIACLFGRG